jgi:anhydro-N-acetylmuramic acid kinase
MRRLAARLPAVSIADTGRRGLPPSQVEACAFAWLARAFVERQAGNVVTVTGARGPRILGALYPGAV